MNNSAKKYAISELDTLYAFLIDNGCQDEKILSQIDNLQNSIEMTEEEE